MTEVVAAAPWTDMFEPERNQGSGRAEALLGSSSLTLAPLMAESASVRRSQPIFIASNRYAKGGLGSAARGPDERFIPLQYSKVASF